MTSSNEHHRGRGLTALLAASALSAVTALAGCNSTTATSDVDLTPYDYRLRHPILISDEPEVFKIPVGMKGPALSPEIETALYDFVIDYQTSGTGGITIQPPTGSGNEMAAAETGRAVHYALVNAGVPRSSITVAPYFAGDYGKPAPLQISFLKVKATTPTCGIWPEVHPATGSNAQPHNFGCAAQQNLAAMVANPADLIRPRELAPANGARRAKVITDYSQGADTQSEVQLLDSDLSASE